MRQCESHDATGSVGEKAAHVFYSWPRCLAKMRFLKSAVGFAHAIQRVLDTHMAYANTAAAFGYIWLLCVVKVLPLRNDSTQNQMYAIFH